MKTLKTPQADSVAHAGAAAHADSERPLRIEFGLLFNSQWPIPSNCYAVLSLLPCHRVTEFNPLTPHDVVYVTKAPDVTAVRHHLRRKRSEIVCFQQVHGPRRAERGLHLHRLRLYDGVNSYMAAATNASLSTADNFGRLYPEAGQACILTFCNLIDRQAIHESNWADRRDARARPLETSRVTSVAADRLLVLERSRNGSRWGSPASIQPATTRSGACSRHDCGARLDATHSQLDLYASFAAAASRAH